MSEIDEALETIDDALERLEEDRRRLQAAREALRPPLLVVTGAGEKFLRKPGDALFRFRGLEINFPPIAFSDPGFLGAFGAGGARPAESGHAISGAAADVVVSPSEPAAEADPEPSIEEEKPEPAPAREAVDEAKRQAGRRGGRPPSARREAVVAVVGAHIEDGVELREILEELPKDLRPSSIEGLRQILKRATDAGEIVKVAGERSNAPARFYPPSSRAVAGVAGGQLPASPPARRSHRRRSTELREESAATREARHDRAVLTVLEKAEDKEGPEAAPLAPGQICKAAKLSAVDVVQSLERLHRDDRVSEIIGRPNRYRAREVE